MTIRKTIVFFPSPAALGPCLNLIGIAQRLSQKGYRSVFVVDPLMAGPARSYGLEAVSYTHLSSASTVLPVPGSPLMSRGRPSVIAAFTATIKSGVAT